jgi:hypothetical protein
MNTFYSIIRVSPNNVAGDHVAIGIVLFDSEKIRYYFSAKKRKIASRLIEDKSLDLNFIVKQFIQRFEEINKEQKNLQLFSKYNKISGVSYFDYLNRYSQGLVGFSSPYLVNDRITDEKFEKIIELVFNEPSAVQGNLTETKNYEAEEKVYEQLILPLQEKVHTNYKFSRTNLPSIYFSFEMDCIGLNGSLIGAKHLSFDKSQQTLDRNLGHYFTLLSTLTNNYNKNLKENDFFLISDEPSDIKSIEHQVWESVNSNELIKVIPSEKAGDVAMLIFEKGAHKFLEE